MSPSTATLSTSAARLLSSFLHQIRANDAEASKKAGNGRNEGDICFLRTSKSRISNAESESTGDRSNVM